MTPERWRRVDEVFRSVASRSESEQSIALQESCADDSELRDEVLSLLAAHRQAGRLEPPGPVGTLGEGALPIDDPLIGKQIGRYTLIRVLGYGGMGTVYEATQEEPKRRVALKIVRTGGFVDQSAVKLFRREVQALALLNHPHIAALYDSNRTEDGQHYFAMELVQGQPLTEHAKQFGLSLQDRLELFARLCQGIEYAHQRGVIHRDLKPSNILVDRLGCPKVLDFGLARITDSDVALTTMSHDSGKIQGTLAYMSPEQARGQSADIDLRSDVYSLGVLLYELLTGQLPYDIRSAVLPHAVHLICDEPPRRPSSIRKTLRGDLETIALKALEKEPERRYQSATEFAEDLRRYRLGQPVSARPASATYVLKKLVRRHRAGVAMAAAFCVVVLASTFWGWTLYGRSQANLTRALAAEKNAHTEAGASRRVSEFLAGLFRASDPSQEHRRDITARELLDRAAARIPTELNEDPLVRAKLMDTIGAAYQSLDLFDPATQLIEGALKIRRDLLGEVHPDVAASLRSLGWLRYRRTVSAVEAEPIMRQAVEVYRKLGTGDSDDFTRALTDLGWFLTLQGKHGAAEPILKEAQAICTRLHGPKHGQTIQVWGAVAGTLYYSGKYDEAESMLRELAAVSAELYGPEHPNYGDHLHNLGLVLYQEKKYAEAESVLRPALAIDRAARGNQPHVGSFVTDLGLTVLALGRTDEAEELFREAQDLRCQSAGLEKGFGLIAQTRGNHDEAAKHFEESLARAKKNMHAGDRRLRSTVLQLSKSLINLRRFEEAERVLLEHFEQSSNSQGGVDSEDCLLKDQITRLYDAWGKPDRAIEWRGKLQGSQGLTESAQESPSSRPSQP